MKKPPTTIATSNALGGSRGSLAYLALETPREGQASHTHIHEIIQGLRNLGWQVNFIATRSGGASSGTSYVIRVIDYIRAQWALARRLSAVDAVYMRTHFAALPVTLLCNLLRKPVFQELNGLPDDDVLRTYVWLRPLGHLIRSCYIAQLRRAAHIFVVTDGLANWTVQKAQHQRVSVITNAANTHVFRPDGPRTVGLGRYVVFIGGLTAWHGIRTMVEATQSSFWPDDVALIVIGDGIEREVVRKAAAHGERIRWLGRLSQYEVATYLRGALAALSITEDKAGRLSTGVAPLKLFEAMASGIPVIVSDLPYQRDVIRDAEAGIVIAMGDSSALASAVAMLATNPREAARLGRGGATFVAKCGSWQHRADALTSIMSEALHVRR